MADDTLSSRRTQLEEIGHVAEHERDANELLAGEREETDPCPPAIDALEDR